MTTIATAAGASRAAEWTNMTEVGADYATVGNPRMIVGDDYRDDYRALTLSDTASVQSERAQALFAPRFYVTRYLTDKSLDTDTGVVDLNAQWKLERSQVGFGLEGGADSTLTSELGLTGITTINRRHEFGTASANYHLQQSERLSWSAQGAWSLARYTDAAVYGLRNYDYASFQAGPYWNLTQQVQAALLLGADRILPRNDASQHDYSASVQLRRTVNEQFNWHASVGITRVDLGATAGDSSVLELGISRHAERLQWDVTLARNVSPIGLGLLARKEQGTLAATVATSEHSALRLTFSLIRSEPVTVSQIRIYDGALWGQVGADWRWQLTERWAITSDYSRGRARPGNSGRWADGNQLRINVTWQGGRL